MKRLVLIALLCLSVVPAVRAETLNLDQAIDRALHADPRIGERKHLVDAARALLQQALGENQLHYDVNAFVGLAPGVDGGFFENGATSCVSPCKPRSDSYKFHDGLSLWTGVQFSIIKPLYTFGKIENYSEAAQGNVDVKRADVRIQRDKTRLQVTKAYYGYLAARDTRYVLEDAQQRLASAETLARRWLKEGKGDVKQSDLYELQAGEALVAKYLAQAKSVEAIALDGLKVLTGVGLDHELTLADDHLRPVPLPTKTLAQWRADALAKRPEIAQLDAGLRARRALVAAHKADEKPNVYMGLVGSLSYAPNRDRLDNPYLYDPYNHAGVTPVVGIKWQWDSGVQPAKVARAEAQMNALVEKAAYARQGIPFQVAEAYHKMIAAHQSVQDLARGSVAARRWMISRYADYQAGLEEANKVMTALKGYVTTRADYLSTLNDYNFSVTKMKSVAGEDQ
ncbi:MAG: TolC family protein [Gammaproteobacteria bacterium]